MQFKIKFIFCITFSLISCFYSIVGQVAVTGKHQWICADNQVTSSSPSIKVRILILQWCNLHLVPV